ncbi:hypothetical protein ACFVYR_38085, partial [Streptomyces sp. NPDC058284]|uniref:hypothetical protein n=1 Tax=unclassified Streptomyces TaxID=2593676 RepID=UPI003667FC48
PGKALDLGQTRTANSLTATPIRVRRLRNPALKLGAPDSFHGQARLDLVDAGTAKAATHVAYDGGEGHPWYPPEVVLIGNRAAITPHEAVAGPGSGPDGEYRTEPDATAAAEDDADVHAALETRWLAQPAHIEALLDGATGVRAEQDGGTRTLTGSTPLRALAADPAVGALYLPYATDRPAAPSASPWSSPRVTCPRASRPGCLRRPTRRPATSPSR